MNNGVGFLRGNINSHFHSVYGEIISLKNLFTAWREFKIGKIKREDVARFALSVENHIFSLHGCLSKGEYVHGDYEFFSVQDPKPRDIHKALVRDRVLHHAIVRIIGPLFDKIFIFDSYSSRKEKGTHKAIERFVKFAWRLSRNDTKTVWVLKCDVKKYFDSVNQKILIKILGKTIKGKLLKLLTNIIQSFEKSPGRGIPLGNLTSQLFSNIYLNELDQFIKRKKKIKQYIRYADDFVVMSNNRKYLEELILEIDKFLNESLELKLNSEKVFIKKWHMGIDFLGYIVFPYFVILRMRTRKRMIIRIKIAKEKYLNKEIDIKKLESVINSYAAVLGYCRSKGIKNEINAILNNRVLMEKPDEI